MGTGDVLRGHDAALRTLMGQMKVLQSATIGLVLMNHVPGEFSRMWGVSAEGLMQMLDSKRADEPFDKAVLDFVEQVNTACMHQASAEADEPKSFGGVVQMIDSLTKEVSSLRGEVQAMQVILYSLVVSQCNPGKLHDAWKRSLPRFTDWANSENDGDDRASSVFADRTKMMADVVKSVDPRQ